MSRKSKRLAGHQFADRKEKAAAKAAYVRPVFCDEIDTPHWDDDWYAHCEMEAPYQDAPIHSDTTDWCAFAYPGSPCLLPGIARSDSGSVFIDGAERYHPNPLLVAASRKEQQNMIIKIPATADCPPVFNGGHAKLALVTDRADYERTMAAYHTRCSHPDSKEAQRAWNAISAASVLATRREAVTPTCPVL